MKKGFTLVELSIVLVIIGLLIGGILVGQSLIESAKISTTIKQISQFDSAVNSFESKFRQIPGDSKFHGGDGDGTLESHNAFTSWDGAIGAYSSEVANFWSQAFPDLYTGGTYTSGSTGAIDIASIEGPNKTMPAAKIGKGNSGFYASTYSDDGLSSLTTNTDNYYSITSLDAQEVSDSFNRLASADEGNKVLRPVELLSIDSKLDDGIANSGLVLSARFTGDSRGIPTMLPNANCSSGADYLVANDDYECTPFIRMGISTGDLR